MTKPLSKPYGDDSDQICSYEMVIYHVPNVKVGSTNDLKTRLMAQKLRPKDVEILLKVPANSASYNHIWHMEQVNARMLGLPSEHEGNRLAVNRVRTGPLGQSGTYVLTNCETGATTTVSEAGQFERKHDLYQSALSKCANPKQSRKHVTVNGVKHTVAYADQQKGGE
ncbi:MAG: hypothetical protein P8H92_11575 [Paracoccaceae bacterium]|nr:hypothetical protein [Paracoccaceae bacterium]